MDEIINDYSDPKVPEIIELHEFEWFKRIVVGNGEQIIEPDINRVASNVASTFFNAIFFAQIEPKRLNHRVIEIIESYKVRKVPLVWKVGPLTKPSNLGEYLESAGLVKSESVIGMAADLTKLNEEYTGPAGLEVKIVRDFDALKDYCRVACTVFAPDAYELVYRTYKSQWESDDRVLFIGYLSGKPVASTEMIPVLGVTGIYTVATLPEARKMGIGGVITLNALQAGRDMGYRVGVLQSSGMGFKVYAQLGFKDYFPIVSYRGKA
jgi:ribosomal protein S18 acetylase RimI-like enzyme